jgi:hypothetical protein
MLFGSERDTENDSLVPRESTVHAEASMIIKMPSGEFAESAQILTKHIREDASVFCIRGP